MARLIFKRPKPDPYIRLGELGSKLAELRVRVQEVLAEEAAIKQEMNELASALTTPQVPAALVIAVEEIDAVSRRRRELLQLLNDHPGERYSFYARKIYGENTRTTRVAVAGLFNLLRRAGLVERNLGSEHTSHVLTEKGRQALVTDE